MSISLIAAVAENGAIGKDGGLPWHIPEDLKRFKKLTLGKVVVMGRKTYESVVARLGGPLPQRTNVVISRQKNYSVPAGVFSFGSPDEAFERFRNKDIFVIGGGQIYAQTMSRADTLYVTHIARSVDGDTHFPRIDPAKWELAEEERGEGFRFSVYVHKDNRPKPTTDLK